MNFCNYLSRIFNVIFTLLVMSRSEELHFCRFLRSTEGWFVVQCYLCCIGRNIFLHYFGLLNKNEKHLHLLVVLKYIQFKFPLKMQGYFSIHGGRSGPREVSLCFQQKNLGGTMAILNNSCVNKYNIVSAILKREFGKPSKVNE